MTTDITTATEAGKTAFSSILVPVDGSEASARAVEVAARFEVDRIVLLRVDAGDAPDLEATDGDIYAQWQHNHVSKLQAELDAVARDHGAGAATVETQIRYGEPAEVIIAEARAHDLLVMSASGKGAAGRVLFGSVADRVVRYGVTPTLFVRVGEHDIAYAETERIVVPLDGSDLAERALPLAARIGAMLKVPVHVVRSVGMDEVLETLRAARKARDTAIFDSDDPYEVARMRTDEEANLYLESMAERARVRGVDATTERLSGTAVFELLWAVQPTDIVVMTSRGQGGYERWRVGSVAEKLLREAKGPVLLVPVERADGAAEGMP